MKRFRPKRSFSTAIGGPNATRRETELVFGSTARVPAVPSTLGSMPGLARGSARLPVRIDMRAVKSAGLPGQEKPGNVRVEQDETLPADTMRVTYDDGTSELLPIPKR